MKDAMRESQAPKDGATKSSLGDASKGDLNKGYFDAKQPDDLDEYQSPVQGGFLGRPSGWER